MPNYILDIVATVNFKINIAIPEIVIYQSTYS